MDIRLRELQSKVRNVALDARALGRVVESEAFSRAWHLASDNQKAQLESYVTGIDTRNVSKWVRSVLASVHLEEKPVRELRDLARAAGMQYVNHKTKEELVGYIRTEEGEGAGVPDGSHRGSQDGPAEGGHPGS